MRYLIRFISRSLIWTVILIGIVVACLRLSFASIGVFKSEIENWVAAEVIPGLTFGDIRSRWNHVSPVFELDQAVITLPDRSNPIIIDTLAIEFDFWGSLVFGTPVIREVIGTVDQVVIRKDIEKRWWLNDISLVAKKSSAAANDIEDLLASIPHYLHLELNSLIIVDEHAGNNFQIDNISADIEHHDEATHLQLLANLPETLGGLLQMKSILEGDVGTVYLQSEQLRLDPIAELLGMPVDKIHEVEAAGEAWINFRDHHIDTVNARLSIDNARYQDSPQGMEIPFNLSLQLSARRELKNWHVSQRLENLSVNDQLLPPLNAQMRLLSGNTPLRVEGWLQDLDLQYASGLGKKHLPEDISDMLIKTDLQGKLENIWFSLQAGDPKSLQIATRAVAVKNKSVGWLPGIDTVTADIVYGRQRAELAVSSANLVLDFGEQFRAPLNIEEFHTVVFADINQQGVTVSIPEFDIQNSDIKVAGRVLLETDSAASAPFLYMRASFEDGVGGQKSKYLPVQLLPKPALNWVDEGIRSVDISDGGVMFHGRLQNIYKMHKERSGELYADFAVDNAEVMFDPDWEIARNGRGRMLFHNLGVDVKLDSIDYADIKNGRARISIPNFGNTVVLADINAGATTEKALGTWLASPVGAGYREIAKNLRDPGGQVNANIRLTLPLASDKIKQQAKVKIRFNNAAINAPAWGLQLSEIDGNVQVTNQTISASGIKARYFKDPVSIDIATDQQTKETLVTTKGLIETGQMLNLLPAGLIENLEGKSHWQVKLAIANQTGTGIQPIVTIESSSDLRGTAVLLPEPLKKTPMVQRATSSTVYIRANDVIDFHAKIGTHVRTRGRLEKTENGHSQLVDLDIGLATILNEELRGGIRLYGSTPRLPIDEWIAVYKVEAARQKPGSRSLLPLLQSVDLNVSQITVLSRKTNNTDFHLTQSASGFDGSINSSEVRGKFHFPHEDSVQNPVLIDLEYANLTRNPGKGRSSGLLPNDMFNTRLTSKEFIYDGRPVTDLELDTSIEDNVMLIDSLSFKRDLVNFKYNGHWTYDPTTKQHVTSLLASIKGKEFGQAMAKLDFGDTIHNGTINFKGEISWPDDVFSPDWDILKGHGKIKIVNGILKDVEPGSGRFVGLLSLNALPRRLALDFSDVFASGLEFDEIKGDLVLVGQSLITGNTRMDGPAAKVKIVGRTGMEDRDYDQKIYVVPKIRYTLPVIGGIAIGSTVGWGLLLFQNFFKSSLDDSFEITYSMTGSWDDPVIKVINKPPPVVKEKRKPRNGQEK